MPTVLMDGFDIYNGTGANTGMQSKWTITNGAISSMVTGRFGGQAFRLANNSSGALNHIWHRTLSSGISTGSVGFAFRAPGTLGSTLGVGGWMFYLTEGSTYHLALSIDAVTGAIRAHRNTSHIAGTLLGASASGVIAANTWHYIELEFVIHDTSGVANIYVDGVAVVSLSGQDTRNAATGVIDRVVLGAQTSNTNITLEYDDLYVSDSGTRLGEQRIETLYPTSDVAQGWGRSSGSTNYTLVDEPTVNGNTDYVQTSSVGDVDTYGFGDLSSTPSAINAVQINAFGLKTDAETRLFALQVKSGATTSDGPSYPLTASYTKAERLLTTNPDTAAAWTSSAVNALQGGPKVVAS